MSKYEEAFKRSIEDPDGFWGEAAENISWYKKWDSVLDSSNAPFYRWFTGGQINTCYNAVDIHVEQGNGDRTAIIFDSTVQNVKRKISYSKLKEQVSKFAGALVAKGVTKGDRVIVYMPMIPEALVAMLACARIGAIHSVVFGGFAPKELAIRIQDAGAKAVVLASCGIERTRVIPYKPLLDEAIEISTVKPETCIVYQREQGPATMVEGRDHDWNEVVEAASPVDCVPLEATDPLYILYTSGTTGIPKGVVRDNGGHAVAMRWTMENIYDIKPGDVYWAASDVGWVVGHSYIVYAPLLTGATTIVFEGKPVGTPDASVFWRIINEYGVKALFTAPTAIRAIKREDPNGEFIKAQDLSCMKYLFLAGERTDPDTYHWARDLLGKPVIDHWWQTETGWSIAGNPMGLDPQETKAGSPTFAIPGWNLQILDDEGKEMPAGSDGIITVKLPLPPGTLLTLWGNDQRCKESYFDPYPGYYFTGDGGHVDEDNYFYVMGRVDDIINVAGHRLSTGSMEEVIAQHKDIAECAVLGVNDSLKGEVPVGFAVRKAGVTREISELEKELVAAVRHDIGPVAAFKTAFIVDALPKTRSGKILRKTIRQMANGDDYTIPSTIDDATVLAPIEEMLKTKGFGKQ